MKRKKMIRKPFDLKNRNTINLLIQLLKTFLLVTSICFFSYLFILAATVKFNIDYIDTLASKELGADPSIRIINENAKTIITEDTFETVGYLILIGFAVLVILVFISPVLVLLIKILKDAFNYFKFSVVNIEDANIRHKQNTISKPNYYYFLKLINFLYSSKTLKDTFEPIIADWQEEYFEALSKKEMWKARWINFRYTYAFIVAMWQKSPIGDLIEYISKLAK